MLPQENGERHFEKPSQGIFVFCLTQQMLHVDFRSGSLKKVSSETITQETKKLLAEHDMKKGISPLLERAIEKEVKPKGPGFALIFVLKTDPQAFINKVKWDAPLWERYGLRPPTNLFTKEIRTALEELAEEARPTQTEEEIEELRKKTEQKNKDRVIQAITGGPEWKTIWSRT